METLDQFRYTKFYTNKDNKDIITIDCHLILENDIFLHLNLN